MALRKPVIGAGTRLRYWDTTSSEWINLVRIQNIGGPQLTRQLNDDTTLDDIDGYVKYYAGLKEGGTVPFTTDYSHDTLELMLSWQKSNDSMYYSILMPDAEETTIIFEGLLQDSQMDVASAGEKSTISCTIMINGEPVLGDPEDDPTTVL